MKKLISSRLAAGLFQLAVMALGAALAALLPLLMPEHNALLKTLLQWMSLPLLGLFTSGVFARSGVTHYLAWLMPPVLTGAVPWLIVGYPLAPGVMLLCCLASMIGASVGDVLRRRAS